MFFLRGRGVDLLVPERLRNAITCWLIRELVILVVSKFSDDLVTQ